MISASPDLIFALTAGLNGRIEMAVKQLTLFDWEAESAAPVPELYECQKTCKHFGESVDYPSWWFGEARCLLMDYEQKVVNNRCIAWCKRYEQNNP